MAAPLTAVALDCDLCHVNLLFRLCLLGAAKRVQRNVARRNRFPGWGWLSRNRRGLVSDPTREPMMATASPRVSPKTFLEVWPKSGRKGLYSWQSMMGESGHAGRAI